MRHPEVAPVPGLPRRVEICEVGARDGLQSERVVLPVADKIELIERLVAAGARSVEVTSLVRADRVPQLADAEELLAALPRAGGVRYPVLVPNRRGLERAMQHDVRDIAVFASATESFSVANLGRSRSAAMASIAEVVTAARAASVEVRGYVSMCFGDPWEGAVAHQAVGETVTALFEMGCREVSIGDTIGVATTGQVEGLLETLVAAGVDTARLAVHFHDTYGQALANTRAALGAGVSVVDASVGGLGGCPFAGSATGNLATEDLLWMLDGLGIETGLDLERIVEVADWVTRRLGRSERSRTLRALAGDGTTAAGS